MTPTSAYPNSTDLISTPGHGFVRRSALRDCISLLLGVSDEVISLPSGGMMLTRSGSWTDRCGIVGSPYAIESDTLCYRSCAQPVAGRRSWVGPFERPCVALYKSRCDKLLGARRSLIELCRSKKNKHGTTPLTICQPVAAIRNVTKTG